MVAIVKLLIFAVGATALRTRQTVAQVLSDLQTLNTDLNAYTAACNNYDGTIGGVAPLQQRWNTILADIKKANTDATNTPQANDADSTTLINYINATITPSLNNAINCLINQKPRLINAGAKTIVQNNISYLKGNTTTLGNTIVAKSSANKKASASAAFSAVISSINRAQAAYA